MVNRTVRQTANTASKEVGELKRKIKILSTSRKLTHEFIGQAHGVKHLMQIVFDRILNALDAEAGSLWIKDENIKKNVCHLAEGPVKDEVIGLKLDFGLGIVGTVIETQKSKIILNCAKSKEFTQTVDQKTGFVTRSMICVPLIIDDEAYGAIQIVNKKHGVDGQFDTHDCELVKDLAISAAISMKNARLMEMESKVKEMNALMSISNEVVSTLDVDQVLNLVVNRTNELVDIAYGAIALVDDDGELSLNVISGGQKVDLKAPRQLAMLALMKQVQNLQRSVYVAERERYLHSQKGKINDWVKYLNQYDVKSLWTVALRDEEGVLGVLWFESNIANFANAGKGDLLHIMASQATVALRNASLFKSITKRKSLSGLKESGLKWFKSKGKRAAIVMGTVVTLLLSFHFLPVLRWVAAPTTVETQLGQGIFTPVDGRISRILVQEGQPVAAGDVVAELDTTAVRLALIEAQAQLAIAERQIVEARAEKDSFALSNAMIQRESTLAKVTKLQRDLTNTAILAPISGVVLNTNIGELQGRHFATGTEIFRIANPDKFRLVVHVAEEDIMDVKIHQEVRAVLRARPGEYVYGKVLHVGRSYDVPTTILEGEEEVDTSELKTGFVAEILITEADYRVLPGMTGQALIYTPDTSVVERYWRRVRNFFVFTLGL
ncbi:GAF domain-containing protein [Planctobacterium marinum]|uniref:GAF domain-containing protein n=1 Tax=Planctobacterium marinum TaxID=1631968 RepID=UPI001E29B910|nr:GAF domain-containing protein [Planctobacterium marinum]MCC2604465.1 GAF domain-containing protein [Planctobacterium marinum]